MKSFLDFSIEQEELLEKLITFGGKAYPKFGQVVILCGGAGSGKGFVLSNLIGIEGNTLDVDALKSLAIGSTKLAKKIKDETGYDLKQFDLRVPANVSKLHELLSDVYGITNAHQQNVFGAALAADPERKPNLIFDTTLKDMGKMEKICRQVQELGYLKENIHIVWILNDVEVALDQNSKRSRVVPTEILMSTHEGAALTMRKILDNSTDLSKYIDGDIWIAFNKVGVDTNLVKSKNGGQYIEDANYIKVKAKGKRATTYDKLSQDLIQKIKSYIPDTLKW